MDNYNTENSNTRAANVILMYIGGWIIASSIFLHLYRKIKASNPMKVSEMINEMTIEEKEYISDIPNNKYVDSFVKRIIDFAVMETINEQNDEENSYSQEENCNCDEDYVILN
jgi:hypothetical protein